MDKGQMIAAIIRKAKDAAILENKHLDVPDLFFSLCFMEEEALEVICKKLGVYSPAKSTQHEDQPH